MEFRLLGPVEVSHEGARASLGGPRQRAVLAMLALAAPEVVSTDRIVDGLWGEEAPAKPLATLQVFIHKLRRGLADVGDATGLLESRPPGYRLAIAHDDTDVGRFEALLERSRTHGGRGDLVAAHDALVEALALWRGPALADVREAPFAQAEVARLDESHLLASEDRFDLAIQLGRHAESVAALEERVRAHPTRERLWAQLMVALYRSERQADALAAYGRAREQLADELGIDPGEALQQLELAVLRQDPDLRAPLRSGPTSRPVAAPRPAARIPAPLTPTIGRDELVADVLTTILRPEVRIASLTGLGGTGKSRVAAVAAAAAEGRFDEVCFVLATERTESAQLAHEIALVLGCDGADDPLDGLRSLDPNRSVLLVLDNLESLTDGPDLVSRLAGAATSITMLVTSRLPLRLTAEHEIPVPALEVPREDATTTQILESPAVRLFLARAEATSRGFRVAGAEETVAALCRLLDGVPLALELAAARLKLFGIDRLLETLRSSLGLLTTGSGDVPERQRALASTIQWSYDRLDEPARLLCDRLALFERGFTIEAVEAICDDVPSVIDSLGAVLDARLVRSVESRVEVRFVVLGTVRAFARDRLAAHTDLDLRRRLLALHLLGRLAAWGTDLDGPTGAVALGRFDDESADVEAAIGWAVDREEAELAASLTLASLPFWVASGRLKTGLAGAERVRSLQAHDEATQGRLSAAIAQLAYHLTDWDRAALECEQALASAGRAADEATAAVARCYLGATLVVTGDADRGAVLAGQALDTGERLGLYPVPAVALSVLAIARAMAGDLDGERDTYARRLAVVRRHGDTARTADTLNTLAEIALDESDTETAEAYARESLGLAEGLLPLESRDALITLARAAVLRQDTSTAAGLLRRALDLSDRTGQSLAVAQCLRVGACLAGIGGDAGGAVQLFAAAQSFSPSPNGTDEPVERDLARSLAEARMSLGESASRRQWTLGGGLPAATVRGTLDAVLDQL